MKVTTMCTKHDGEIEGERFATDGNLLFYCKELNQGQLTVEKKDDDLGIKYEDDFNFVCFNGTLLFACPCPRNWFKGTSRIPIKVSDEVEDHRPQLKYTATNTLVTQGTSYYKEHYLQKSLKVERVFYATIYSTFWKKDFLAPLLGCEFSDEKLTINGDVVSYKDVKASLKDLQEQFAYIERRAKERAEAREVAKKKEEAEAQKVK